MQINRCKTDLDGLSISILFQKKKKKKKEKRTSNHSVKLIIGICQMLFDIKL